MGRFKEALAGVFVPVVTPFEGGKPNLEALERFLAALASSSLAGYLALGSNGEGSSLTEEERAQLLELFARESKGRPVMVGVSVESTHQAAKEVRRAAELGLSYACVQTPHYFVNRMTDSVIEDFFLTLADLSPIPIILYNAPGFTAGVKISPAVVKRVAKHENIAGIKDSSAVGPGAFLANVDERADFAVLAGSTSFLYPCLHLGAAGGVLSVANYLPDPCVELYQLFRRGEYVEAAALHHRLFRVNQSVSKAFGVAGVKAAMELMGYPGKEPRPPLQRLSEMEIERIKEALQRERFIRL